MPYETIDDVLHWRLSEPDSWEPCSLEDLTQILLRNELEAHSYSRWHPLKPPMNLIPKRPIRERVIGGVLHSSLDCGSEWLPFTSAQLTQRILAAWKYLKDVRNTLHDMPTG